MKFCQRIIKKLKLPVFLKENGNKKITSKKDIANKFNNYFTNIGHTIASSITIKSNKEYSHCLNKQVNSVFTFKNVDEETKENH